MAHLAWRYPQDLAVAAEDRDRRRGHRGRNLFARAGRSLERLTGASDKSQRILACRRRPALPSRGLSGRASRLREWTFQVRLCRTRRGTTFVVTALPPHFDFRPTFALVSPALVRRDPVALRPGKGEERRRRSCLTLDTLSSSTRTNG